MKTRYNNKRIQHNNIKQWLIEYNHNDWDWILLGLIVGYGIREKRLILFCTGGDMGSAVTISQILFSIDKRYDKSKCGTYIRHIMCACIDDKDGSLLYGFNLVCLHFDNQVMPDGSCVFEDEPYDCFCNCVWGTPARDSCFRKYNRWVDLESMVSMCVCQVRLESK